MPKLFNKPLKPGTRTTCINRDCYAMSTTTNGDEAEILMYGEIVENRPTDWYGKPVEGNFIILSEFMEDLDKISGAKSITVRMNSIGGAVYAALPIHNRLRELAAHITAIVDGVAMSAASFIMCAADTVKVNAASLIMIHNAAAYLFGGYNAAEMRQMAAWLDTVDKAIVSAYVRKSGMSEDDILKMMGDTTYMTGKEAIDKGFADELSDGEPVSIAASADGSTLVVNGRALRLAYPLSGLPENIPTVNSEAVKPAPDSTDKNQPMNIGGTEGGTIMAKTLDELRAENPELAAALMAEAHTAVSSEIGKTGDAVNAEKKRLMDIDAIASQFDPETVHAAKYGDKPMTAQEMAYAAAVDATKHGKQFMAAMLDDAAASGTSGVGAAPGSEPDKESPEAIEASAKAAVAAYRKTKEAR